MADWDAFSNLYDNIFLEFPQYRETISMMVEMIDCDEGCSVVDLGCGTGNTMAALTEEFPKARVTGVDPSRGMREKTSGRFLDNPLVTVIDGNALGIPLPDREADCIVSNLALHHVEPGDRHAAALEIGRVLKAGGRLVYADMFTDVDGPPEDPNRCRDIIRKFTATALHCVDEGAMRMMMIVLETLPKDLSNEGEYLTTPGVWSDHFESAGFSDFEITEVPPPGLGIYILTAVRG